MTQDGWFQTSDGQTDYLFSREPGAIAHMSSFHLDGHEYPCRTLSTLGLSIQIGRDAAATLTGDVGPDRLFRRAGLGRVRKDLSTPLNAPADRVWIQALDGDAVLVLRLERDPERVAFFRLGLLSDALRQLGHTFGRVSVRFLLADDFLPDAGWRHLHRLVAERRAWGGLVSCTSAE